MGIGRFQRVQKICSNPRIKNLLRIIKQRVAIARAIAARPPVILADEPTGNLDSASSREIMEILKGMHRSGETLILITHDNGIAAQARRVVRIMDGKIESDTINEEFVEEA